jgi:hypothetical protein
MQQPAETAAAHGKSSVSSSWLQALASPLLW